MPTSNPVEVVQALIDLIKDNWSTIGLANDKVVYYGDEARVNKVPAVTVEPNNTDSERYQTGLQTLHTFTIFVTLHYAQIKGDSQTIKKERDEVANKLRLVINGDTNLGGLITQGLIVKSEPGIQQFSSGSRFFSTRLTWEGTSRTLVGV